MDKRKFLLLLVLLLVVSFLSCSNVKNEKINIKNETTTELKMCFITFSQYLKTWI
jgi:hypothetical protein